MKSFITGLAGVLLMAAPAMATPSLDPLITVAVQTAGMTDPLTIDSGPSPLLTSFTDASAPGFSGSVQVFGSPDLVEPNLASGTISTSSTSGGELKIFITEQNLSGMSGKFTFNSGFTENFFFGDVQSITETTFWSPTNVLFGGDMLAQQTFTGIGSVTTPDTPFISGIWSETVEYDVVMGDGGGTVNATINVNTPEPGDLSILAVALIGLGVLVRPRKRGTMRLAA
jgi:hypothetical protein